ncbi:NAD(P)-dependent oxidoreductase [Embleya sp. NPDC050154]|uniref:NAD(P)-dependent oxidoreductase n=1 Tax=Embleya sp. NPDC050154 TaxID=3363988 RepID=UPI0037AB32BF
MRITVFGAAGNVGSRVVSEALSRGHEVTAVVRDAARFPELHPDAEARVGDAARVMDVAALSTGQDLVISATRPAHGSEQDLADTAEALLAGLTGTGIRLLTVGGAGSLTVPDAVDTMAVDDPRFVPTAWRGIALACNAQLDVFRADDGVDWTYLSPPANLEPGTRTGAFRVGTDELLIDADGVSAISMEDLAVALIDEAEQPKHHRSRFTVAY